MVATTLLNLKNCYFVPPLTLICPVFIHKPKLMHISSLATKIWLKNQIYDGICHCLHFYQRCYFGPIGGQVVNIYLHTKCDALIFKATKMWWKIQIQGSGCHHPEFPTSAILAPPRNSHKVNIYLQIWCRWAHRSRSGRLAEIHLFVYFQDGGCPPSLMPSTTSPSTNFIFSTSGAWFSLTWLIYCDFMISLT